MHKQLYRYFENNKILNDNQYGFRKQKSTINAIDKFLSQVYSSINKQEYIIAIYLDFSKAFDTVNHSILKQQLKDAKLDDNSLKWFNSYLGNRTQKVTANGILSQSEPSNYGVPQGSTLGPLLYIIYVNEMVHALKNGTMITFADDTVIINCGRSISDTIRDSEEDLERVALWCRENKLSLNTEKTKSMYFHKAKNIHGTRNLKFENQFIDQVREYKYLGLVINQELDFRQHLKNQINSINVKLYHFRKIRKFISESTAITIYKVLIAPIMKYAQLFLCSGPASLLDKQLVLQNKALRIIYNLGNRTNVDDKRCTLSILTPEIERRVEMICHSYLLSLNQENCDLRALGTRSHTEGRRQLKIINPINNKIAKSYYFISRKWWNQLPTHLHQIPNIREFKIILIENQNLLNNLTVS